MPRLGAGCVPIDPMRRTSGNIVTFVVRGASSVAPGVQRWTERQYVFR